MERVVTVHGQHVVQALLRKRRVRSGGRLVQRGKQREQAGLGVFIVRRAALQVGQDLQLSRASARFQCGNRPLRVRGVARRGGFDQVIGVFDGLTVGRRGRRFCRRGQCLQRRERKEQRCRYQSPCQDAVLQVRLAAP